MTIEQKCYDEGIAAERERCAKILDERARQLVALSPSGVMDEARIWARADEASFMASVLRCTCKKGLAVSGANHAPGCPTHLWWFQNEANVNEGA